MNRNDWVLKVKFVIATFKEQFKSFKVLVRVFFRKSVPAITSLKPNVQYPLCPIVKSSRSGNRTLISYNSYKYWKIVVVCSLHSFCFISKF